jgi:hypothetical protein
MSLPIPNPHVAVTMLAFFQGTQLNLFERFLTQAVAGIDSTSITSGMQTVAYVVLLVGFLWQVYQSALHGGDVRGLGTNLIKYIVTAVVIMNYGTVFTTINQGFVNAGTYAGTMQETCLRLMGKKMLVALMLEGKFSGEGLMALDADEDLMSAMARELVEKAGVGESADLVWRQLEKERGQLVPQPPPPIQHESDSLLDLPDFVVANPSWNHDGIHLLEPVRTEIKSTPWPAAAVPVQLSLFG